MSSVAVVPPETLYRERAILLRLVRLHNPAIRPVSPPTGCCDDEFLIQMSQSFRTRQLIISQSFDHRLPPPWLNLPDRLFANNGRNAMIRTHESEPKPSA